MTEKKIVDNTYWQKEIRSTTQEFSSFLFEGVLNIDTLYKKRVPQR